MKTKAVRIYGANDIRLEEFDLPEMKEDEILAKVISDSVCMSTHKAALQGAAHARVPNDIAEHPTIIGHEFCGEILAVGKKWQDQFKAGDRFSIQPAMGWQGKLDAPGYSYLALDGMDNCIAAIKDIIDGKVHKCFIEMSACVGSCVGGPVMEKYHLASAVQDYIAVSDYAGSKDFVVSQPKAVDIKKSFSSIEQRLQMPSEIEIGNVLRQMGKFKPSQELNCGSCGYNTCREKAVAILQGKAEISMCLPYLKDKAESFSDAIVNNSPNGLIVLNENLEVQQVNTSARRIMNIRSAGDIVGDQVIRVLDPTPFVEVLRTGRDIQNERVYLAEYKRYVEQTIVHAKDSRLLIAIMRDVTDEQYERERKESISRQTVEVADKVVDKQMRIVQEIASLLGETAAETKIALAKLKESIQDE